MAKHNGSSSGAARALTSESELAEEWRILVKVTIADPRWPHDEIDDSRPTHSRGTIRPSLEIYSLVLLEFRRFEFFSFALVLDSLLAFPPAAYDERAGWPGNEIRKFCESS